MNTSQTVPELNAWQEAPKELRTAPPERRRKWADLYAALVGGKTIFVKDEFKVRAQAAVRVTLASQHPDKMLRIRSITHNNEHGLVMWVDDRPE